MPPKKGKAAAPTTAAKKKAPPKKSTPAPKKTQVAPKPKAAPKKAAAKKTQRSSNTPTSWTAELLSHHRVEIGAVSAALAEKCSPIQLPLPCDVDTGPTLAPADGLLPALIPHRVVNTDVTLYLSSKGWVLPGVHIDCASWIARCDARAAKASTRVTLRGTDEAAVNVERVLLEMVGADNVQCLTLDFGPVVTADALKWAPRMLEHFPVASLTLHCVPSAALWIAPFAASLTSLDLSSRVESTMDDHSAVARALKAARVLTTLSLAWCGIGADGEEEALSVVPATVTTLRLHCCVYTERGRLAIAALPKLCDLSMTNVETIRGAPAIGTAMLLEDDEHPDVFAAAFGATAPRLRRLAIPWGLLRRCAGLPRDLPYWHSRAREEQVDDACASIDLPRLTELRVRDAGCQINARRLFNATPALTSLRCDGASVDHRGVLLAAECLPHLTSLTLTGGVFALTQCSVVASATAVPHLRKLHLADVYVRDGTFDFIASLEHLEELSLNVSAPGNASNVTTSLKSLAISLTGPLRQLTVRLHKDTEVKALKNTIEFIARQCPHLALVVLDVPPCNNRRTTLTAATVAAAKQTLHLQRFSQAIVLVNTEAQS